MTERPSAPHVHLRIPSRSMSGHFPPFPASMRQMHGCGRCVTKKLKDDENGNRYQCPLRPLVQGTSGFRHSEKSWNAKREGGLVVSAPVYAELLAYPKAKESFVNDFLADTGIAVDFEFQQPVWLGAGRRFARYAKRRRRSAHQGPKRLLADFIIGSHALAQADRFM